MLCQQISNPRGLTLDVPGCPLSEVRDWFCAKKVVRVPNSGLMGKTLGLDKSGPRREVIRLLRWSGTEVILYTIIPCHEGKKNSYHLVCEILVELFKRRKTLIFPLSVT